VKVGGEQKRTEKKGSKEDGKSGVGSRDLLGGGKKELKRKS